MKIRAHRGSLEEAMKTVREIDPTLQAVVNYLEGMGYHLSGHTQVNVSPYGWDDRIAWNTFIVTIAGFGVAFTDGPIGLTIGQICADIALRCGAEPDYESLHDLDVQPVQFYPAVEPIPEDFVPALLAVSDLWRWDR